MMMVGSKHPLLTLTLVLMTLTLTLSCRFSGFFCNPRQAGCPGGMCTVSGGGCVCRPASSYYMGYDPYGLGSGYRIGGRGRRPRIEPEKLRKMHRNMHPFSDRNIEQQTELLSHMVKLDRIIN
ncbi:uncharacterized protein LOC143277655 [Babylonia areolata]|uniref:uncharacterized protein LOC143277655 n=1 Tax=Babylonia areolata TaxID=304850 RepID=UPI003FD5CAF2